MDWWEIISNAIRTGIGSTVIIYALAAIGLNLHFGYTGLLNFGQVGFMAAGAYGVGVMTRTYGHPLWGGCWSGSPRASCWLSCSGSPPCGCAPTTSPS